MSSIALVEPFFSGSHAFWAEKTQRILPQNTVLFTLPGRHWKWRMHGAAISLAQEINGSQQKFDLIIVSDMLDLSLFKASLSPFYRALPIVLYFHENQLSYPWSPKDVDPSLGRDRHYGFINYSSALAADLVVFNSSYHKESFLNALPSFLKGFPDFQNLHTIDIISQKSEIIPIPIDIPEEMANRNWDGSLNILWNHRWEFDKNPDDFYNYLMGLKVENVAFQLFLLGASGETVPTVFEKITQDFSEEIVKCGFLSKRAYQNCMMKADILPVFSNQDFFGISVVEAMANGVIPILPNRLAYPEHLPKKWQSLLLFEQMEEAVRVTKNLQTAESSFIFDLRKDIWLHLKKYKEQSVADLWSLQLEKLLS